MALHPIKNDDGHRQRDLCEPESIVRFGLRSPPKEIAQLQFIDYECEMKSMCFPIFMKKLSTICLLALAFSASALEAKPMLSLALAEVIANACLADQQVAKYNPINVVVVDDGGNTILNKRQDGACKACGAIATGKARTAAMFNAATRDFERLSFGEKRDGTGATMPALALVPGVVALPGGLPLVVDGVTIGGVGVSGASSDEDERCAAAGVAKIRGLLK